MLLFQFSELRDVASAPVGTYQGASFLYFSPTYPFWVLNNLTKIVNA